MKVSTYSSLKFSEYRDFDRGKDGGGGHVKVSRFSLKHMEKLAQVSHPYFFKLRPRKYQAGSRCAPIRAHP
jgi:hypothetical protein